VLVVLMFPAFLEQCRSLAVHCQDRVDVAYVLSMPPSVVCECLCDSFFIIDLE